MTFLSGKSLDIDCSSIEAQKLFHRCLIHYSAHRWRKLTRCALDETKFRSKFGLINETYRWAVGIFGIVRSAVILNLSLLEKYSAPGRVDAQYYLIIRQFKQAKRIDRSKFSNIMIYSWIKEDRITNSLAYPQEKRSPRIFWIESFKLEWTSVQDRRQRLIQTEDISNTVYIQQKRDWNKLNDTFIAHDVQHRVWHCRIHQKRNAPRFQMMWAEKSSDRRRADRSRRKGASFFRIAVVITRGLILKEKRAEIRDRYLSLISLIFTGRYTTTERMLADCWK